MYVLHPVLILYTRGCTMALVTEQKEFYTATWTPDSLDEDGPGTMTITFRKGDVSLNMRLESFDSYYSLIEAFEYQKRLAFVSAVNYSMEQIQKGLNFY